MGLHEIHTVTGRFQLTVDLGTGAASFDKVDANLSESPFLYTQSLDVLFNMTGLVGTISSDTVINFTGKTAQAHPVDVNLAVTLSENSAQITGGTFPPCCDFFIYNLDAVAYEYNQTYYINAADGNDNNDGLSPQTAFATIQKGVNTAYDGDTIIVYPGLYTETINFLGKNIILKSTDPTNLYTVKSTTISGLIVFRGTEQASCKLAGFDIKGNIFGFDWDIDPNGDNHTHATISRCVLENLWTGCGRLIYACDGKISNCTIANIGYMCLKPWPTPEIVGCHGLFENCTFVAVRDGIEVFEGRTCTLKNCIISRSTWALVPSGATLNISYCNFEGGRDRIWGHGIVNWGPGNIDADPCFVRLGDLQTEGDYHLKSRAGRWDPNNQTWIQDKVTSPCIDAGNPGCPIEDEPAPNGNRINMGAYGGTIQASKSPPNWRSIADSTNDWTVNSKDLKVFANYWLQMGLCIPGDFNRSKFVDFNDFAIFGLYWSYPSAFEPGMTFHIDHCTMEAGHNWTAAAETNQTRFSVWVEGRYIYFEDRMYANCCPEELGLDNQINGNEITLYEIGYGGVCYCMCYFPITATLGPFEDGTYTVEVYDNYGNPLGIVVVTIGGTTEPGITYQIEDCNRMASDVLAAETPEPTRFTATVEGPYIQFKDMMSANCCPDKLELEMTVEDKLITIQEIETTTEGCRCICSFPVTATLGPFEPGTYIIEVYETMGGFIGATAVTIGPDQ
ncbi:MAG: hypothetical protein GWN55_15570 [Phycisphaerae bacterium]|nr:hypothetical protein [Phycisphaerae bacterium]NIP53719.1 hypothetical protein [Phycisphaerae bacterium]NIS52641.1 hypothetical protein [Phycisphaerae bacterium]NIU10120.1 hypothetical protein [Phycisphaerae bacterium]NIV02714.1 hypothetical protein [Phycisphaerae bacterium]